MLKRLIAVAVVITVVTAGRVSAQASSVAVASHASSPLGEFIVVLEREANRGAVVERARFLGGDVLMQYGHALNGFAASLPEAAVKALAMNANVVFIAPSTEYAAASHCTQPVSQCLPEGVDRIDADTSSVLAGNGAGAVAVNVGVLDSGIDATHPDLRVVGGKNCTKEKTGFSDPSGHGTHVAGTIAAKDDAQGVVGVAPGAPLWAIRVLDSRGRGSDANVLCGIDFVATTLTDADPTNDIRVANMSLSQVEKTPVNDADCGRASGDAIHMAICSTSSAGAVFVAAAGNGASDLASNAPAAYDEVLSVTAIADYDGRPGSLGAQTCLSQPNADDSVVYFSNFAGESDRGHTVAAPGACIASTVPGGYFSASGTSQAAPHVAGTVALCLAKGACRGTSQNIIRKIVSDAAAYNSARRNANYGFAGDPLRPIAGKYYGYLVRAGLY